MIVVREVEKGVLRIHVLECDCGRADCRGSILIGTIAPKPYWVTLGICPDEEVAGMLEQLLAPGALRTIVVMVALLGVTRDKLIDRRDECFRQLEEWMRAPEWVENIDVDLIWRTRRVSFGDDFTRTIRSLEAADRAVADLPEGPVPAPSFEVLMDRQVRVDYKPRRSMQ